MKTLYTWPETESLVGVGEEGHKVQEDGRMEGGEGAYCSLVSTVSSSSPCYPPFFPKTEPDPRLARCHVEIYFYSHKTRKEKLGKHVYLAD